MRLPKTLSSRMTIGLTFLLVAVGLPPALSGQGEASWALGQVASDGVTMEGFRVPPGSTVTSESLLRTFARPATVHLRGGQVLRLASHSSAWFEEAPDGAVRMAMREGTATLRGTEAEPLTVAEDMHALFSRDGSSRVAHQSASLSLRDDALLDQVGSGARVGAPTILGARKPCIPREPYPILDAEIRPGTDVRVAKVYFRAAQYSHFYVVEMRGIGDEFEAILPAPAPETREVVYYVEAVSSSLESSRTGQYTADVIDDSERCRDLGGAALFTGGDPGISVLSTVPGSPAFPPGFVTAGSRGAAAAVAAGGGGGGLSPWALGGIAAGGAAGVILLLDDNQGRDEPPASPISPSRF